MISEWRFTGHLGDCRMAFTANASGNRVFRDDNIDAAATLATLFSMRGHEVEIAYDGVQALAG
jgi:hypothetical protein